MNGMEKHPLQIAIDGPVAAGKGDIAGRLARELQITYIYTGAMYRMLALSCIQAGIPLRDVKQVVKQLSSISMELAPPKAGSTDRVITAILDGQDVTDRIMAPDTALGASDVAVIPDVRRRMVSLQQEMAKGKAVVMEGRDIGLRVLPDAQLKIFLTASVEERARRRLVQWKAKGIQKSFTEVLSDTKIRDEQDSTRETDPLKILPDSWILDTTTMTQDEVINAILQELAKRKCI